MFEGLDAVAAAGGGFAFVHVDVEGIAAAGCNSAVDDGAIIVVFIFFDGFVVAIGQLDVDVGTLAVAVGKEGVGFATFEPDAVAFILILCQFVLKNLDFASLKSSLA